MRSRRTNRMRLPNTASDDEAQSPSSPFHRALLVKYKCSYTKRCMSIYGALEGTRTPDLLVRSQTLYPAELPARMSLRGQSHTKGELPARMSLRG